MLALEASPAAEFETVLEPMTKCSEISVILPDCVGSQFSFFSPLSLTGFYHRQGCSSEAAICLRGEEAGGKTARVSGKGLLNPTFSTWHTGG